VTVKCVCVCSFGFSSAATLAYLMLSCLLFYWGSCIFLVIKKYVCFMESFRLVFCLLLRSLSLGNAVMGSDMYVCLFH
jgi:hypothetical protein